MSLKDLKVNDITEVANYAIPPALVKTTLEAVCIMKKVPPKMVGEVGKKVADYWDNAKEMLKKANQVYCLRFLLPFMFR